MMLLRSQSQNGVERGGAARRQPGRDKRGRSQHGYDRDKCESVVHLDAVDVTARKPDGKPGQRAAVKVNPGDWRNWRTA